MSVTLEEYLAGVDAIAAGKPKYRLGGWGNDGTCDCIGLAIGGIRRAGGQWTGTHGSNYARRNELDGFRRVSSASELRVGELVLKGRAPGESGYALPSRYKGGADLTDYYHAGVVRSVDPLLIVHCTGPGIVRDTALGKWRYAGWLRKVAAEGTAIPVEGTVTDAAGSAEVQTATVHTQNGGKLHLRQKPTKACKLYWDVPCGAQVTVLSRQTGSDGWWQVSCNGRVGYCRSEYLTVG